MRVAVVGAGIAGLSAAHALAKRGVETTVIYKDHGATASGAGIVSAQFWDPVLAPYARRSHEIIKELVPVNICGMAQIALSEQMANLIDLIEDTDDELPAELSDALSPQFIRRIVRASFSPSDYWVSNDQLLKALSASSTMIRADVITCTGTTVVTDQGEFEVDHIILAIGPSMKLGIERRRSQLARAKAHISNMLHIVDTGIYMRPDGQGCLVGDGDAPASEDTADITVTAEFLAEANEQVSTILRSPAECTAHSAGTLAFTSNHRPIVRAEGTNWLMYGFGGDGLSLAPAFGEEIARELTSS